MKPTLSEMHVAILKWMGLSDIQPPPPLTLDLLHEAEGKLNKIDWDDYEQSLFDATGAEEWIDTKAFIHASIEHRALALCRTLKLIEEGKL